MLLALAHPIVYHPSTRANHLDQERNGIPALPLQRPINLPPQALNGSDFVPIVDQYVGFGDMVAAVKLGGLFATQSRTTRIRMASRIEFADMRDSPTVLIGAFTNRWTIEMMQSFRYRWSWSEGNKPAIIDSAGGKRWVSEKSEDGHSTEDYILICRLPHSQTGGFVVIGAGLTQYGTEEVGRILSEPDALAPILRNSAKGWETKNLELVLHSQIVGDAPSPPALVASYVW